MSGSDCQYALSCLVLRNVNDWWRARQLVRTQTNLAGGRNVFGSAYSTQVMAFQLATPDFDSLQFAGRQ